MANPEKNMADLRMKLLPQVILFIDLFQLLLLMENMVSFAMKPGDPLKLFSTIFICILYIGLTSAVIEKKSSSGILMVLTVVIFTAQQIQIAIRYSDRQGEQRAQSVLLLFSYVGLIGTCFPLRHYLVPVSVVYACGYWGLYANCEKEQLLHEVIFKFFIYYLLMVGSAKMTQNSLKEALYTNIQPIPFQQIV